MDSAVKFQNMLECKKPSDRREIPCYPMILTWCGPTAGMTQAEIISSNKSWLLAMDKTYDRIGCPDVYTSTSAGDVVFVMGLPARLPGRELDKNAQYQFVETPNMTHEDYKFVVKNGWNAYYNPYLMQIQNPPIKGNFNLILRFIKMGGNTGKNIKHLNKKGMVPIYESATAPAFDVLSMIRSMQEFLMDIYEVGDLVQDVLRRATPEIIKDSITNVKRAKGSRIGIFAMRSSCSFMSPALFEEFTWPYLKQTIEAYWKAGIISILHADGNWLPLMKYFLELPKGSVHFELDGMTDMFKSHAILDGWHSIRGDVPATMLAYGKPDEVSAYCEKIITEIGLKGAFMLGSGCEVPLNAKMENVKAMMNSVK